MHTRNCGMMPQVRVRATHGIVNAPKTSANGPGFNAEGVTHSGIAFSGRIVSWGPWGPWNRVFAVLCVYAKTTQKSGLPREQPHGFEVGGVGELVGQTQALQTISHGRKGAHVPGKGGRIAA